MRGSFSFCDEIQEQDNNLCVTSFDIESHLTNIPLDETINICVNNVFDNKKRVKGLLVKYINQLLTLSVKSSCFVFNNVYYKQVDGVAMGPRLGPTLANLSLVNYEKKWLVNYDIFLLFKARDYVKKFFRSMNSPHPNIKFTCGEENNFIS